MGNGLQLDVVPDAGARTAGDVVRGLARRLAAGHLSAAPTIAVLLMLWIVFGLLNPRFLTSENLVNLTAQSAATGIIALGVVLVLLVGQIDLSVGSVSGLAAAIVAVGSVHLGWPLIVAVAVAIACGAVVGLLYGMATTRLGLPSFVLTLAGLLALAGLQLRVLGPTGSVTLPFASPLVRMAQQGYLSQPVAYAVVGVVVVCCAAASLVERARRERAQLPAASIGEVALRTGILAAVLVSCVAYLGIDRGVSYIFALFVALVAVVDVMLRRTRWGRAVRAVGGDAGAARRAGVPVRRVLVSVFVGCSAFAALGGVVAAGRLAAANQGTGAGETNLTAIAAAVIGGTSLFGGRGSAWSALLGVLVIQSISSGLTLLSLDTSVRYVVTGVVLAVAVTVDTLLHRSRDV